MSRLIFFLIIILKFEYNAYSIELKDSLIFEYKLSKKNAIDNRLKFLTAKSFALDSDLILFNEFEINKLIEISSDSIDFSELGILPLKINDSNNFIIIKHTYTSELTISQFILLEIKPNDEICVVYRSSSDFNRNNNITSIELDKILNSKPCSISDFDSRGYYVISEYIPREHHFYTRYSFCNSVTLAALFNK